jgi:hypothetical protein
MKIDEDFNDYLSCYEVGKLVYDSNYYEELRPNISIDEDKFYIVLGYIISQYYPKAFINLKHINRD